MKTVLNGSRMLIRIVILAFAIVFAGLLNGCPAPTGSPRMRDVPERMIWAWERPEDLRDIHTGTTGIAFLAQTIDLRKNETDVRSRRQPLLVADGTYMMAVTRIETSKMPDQRPEYTEAQLRKTKDLVIRSSKLPNIRAVQVDFDAVVSERDFYRKLLAAIRNELPDEMPLSITSLASWCLGDRWFEDLPIDEAVPMAFDMGADDEKIRSHLGGGGDWSVPQCRESYGLMIGDPLIEKIDSSRRIYFFSSGQWTAEALKKIK